MNGIEISICIPTKNFGAYIGDTLQSIIEQYCQGLEVVIVDGGSVDNTKCIVEALAQRHLWIKYHYQERAQGVDRDLAVAIEMASGKYCWLMSADDVLRQGAIHKVFEDCRTGFDTLLFNRTECDIELRPIRDRLWLNGRIEECTFHFAQRQEMLEYFKQSLSIGAVFSYISSIVFFREKWISLPPEVGSVSKHYMHAHRLLLLLCNGGVHRYKRDSLVYTRGGNDSFLDTGNAGIVRRYLIDVDGYRTIADALPVDDTVRRAFKGIMRREHPWYMWIRVAIRVADSAEWRKIERTLENFGYTSVQLAFVRAARSVEKYFPVICCFRFVRRLSKNRFLKNKA